MTGDQIATFQAVAGVTPDHLALAIRTWVGAALFCWAIWMAASSIHHLRKEKGSATDVVIKLFRVGLVLMMGLILIAYR